MKDQWNTVLLKKSPRQWIRSLVQNGTKKGKRSDDSRWTSTSISTCLIERNVIEAKCLSLLMITPKVNEAPKLAALSFCCHAWQLRELPFNFAADQHIPLRLWLRVQSEPIWINRVAFIDYCSQAIAMNSIWSKEIQHAREKKLHHSTSLLQTALRNHHIPVLILLFMEETVRVESLKQDSRRWQFCRGLLRWLHNRKLPSWLYSMPSTRREWSDHFLMSSQRRCECESFLCSHCLCRCTVLCLGVK